MERPGEAARGEAPELFGERVSRVAGFLPAFGWRERETPDALVATLHGQVTLDEAPALWRRVGELIERGVERRRVVIELDHVEALDGACMALLVHLVNELKQRGVTCELKGGSEPVRRVVALYTRRGRRRGRRVRHGRSMLEQVGQATLDVFGEVVALLDFLGQLVASAWELVRHPHRLNHRDIFLTMERAGADAAPIVMLINFLIGFVMAYQSALQLRQFGANIFVADLVGVSMTRELGPLMTAIIICGRTGAAFAAELGTMKVSEEVDALRTLGFLPLPYLVMPRVLGVMAVAPLLVFLADAVGIAGGLFVSNLVLDVGPKAYWVETLSAVKPWDVWSGALKGVVFAAAIGFIACQQGLSTAGGAEGVGRRTTSAVVAILFALILLDAVFTVVFGALGL